MINNIMDNSPKKNTTRKPLSLVNFDITSATHNPMIAEHPRDSFNNIYAVLSAVKDTVICSDVQGCSMEGKSAHGLYLIMNCVMDALRFEMEQRM